MNTAQSFEVRRPPRSRRWLRVGIYCALGIAVLSWLSWQILGLEDPLSEQALSGHQLSGQRVVEETESADGEVRRDLELRCSCGQVTRLAVRFPATGEPHPLALMLGGRETGRRAVDLVPSLHGWAVAALDYPDPGPIHPGTLGAVRAMPRIRAALRHVVPSLHLALEALLKDPRIDPRHVELVGVSLGSIFVVPEAVRNRRVQRLWLMDGAGDLPALLRHALEPEISSSLLRELVARLVYQLAYGPRFEPERWLPRFAPREVVLVNAREDRRLPMRSVLALQQAAQEPKRIIWLEGGHVRPSRVDELRALAEVFFSRRAEGQTPAAEVPGP